MRQGGVAALAARFNNKNSNSGLNSGSYSTVLTSHEGLQPKKQESKLVKPDRGLQTEKITGSKEPEYQPDLLSGKPQEGSSLQPASSAMHSGTSKVSSDISKPHLEFKTGEATGLKELDPIANPVDNSHNDIDVPQQMLNPHLTKPCDRASNQQSRGAHIHYAEVQRRVRTVPALPRMPPPPREYA